MNLLLTVMNNLWSAGGDVKVICRDVDAAAFTTAKTFRSRLGSGN